MNPIDLTALVGRPVDEARRLVEAQGYQFRVLIQDGQSSFATADLRLDRVNVEVAAGKVVRADIGEGAWYSEGMDLDAKVCDRFHVTRRKLVNFIRINRPRVPSQLSDCGGAGTGCGWCVPFLRQLHRQGVEGGATELECLAPEEYEQRRAAYVRAGHGTPPPGAAPLPPESESPA